MKLGIIGGTGIDEMDEFASGLRETVSTHYGAADVVFCSSFGLETVFVPRHGYDHSVPPHLVNYRAQIAALRALRVDRTVGICAVGSLKADLTEGSLAVLTDFIDLTRRRTNTFYDGSDSAPVHTDLTVPYCPEISGALRKACRSAGIRHEPHAIYVGVDGPRYETPAEIRLYASWSADVIGMTNLPEVVLAREAGLCYGAIGVVSNLACGISPTPLDHEDVRSRVLASGSAVREVLNTAVTGIAGPRLCGCSGECRPAR